MKREPLIKMVGISKSFGTVQALKNVNLELNYNEIAGLVGDNGAGKSTLMKILTGAYTPDEGEIFVEGKRVNFTHPSQSRDMGIEMVYQDMALAENIDVAGNIFLGREPKKPILGTAIKIMDRKKMEKESSKTLDELKIKVSSLKKKVKFLSGGQQKAVAIGRSISRKAKVIIMDEPTAALGPRAVSRLLELIKHIRESGISIIFISHRLQDIFMVGDKVLVLREGERVGYKGVSDTTPEEIANLMVGADLIKSQNTL